MSISFSYIESIIQEEKRSTKFSLEKEAYFWNSLADIGTNISICSADEEEIKCVWSKQLFILRVTLEEIIIELSTGNFDSILKNILSNVVFPDPANALPTIEKFIIQYHAKKLANYFNCYVSIPIPTELYDNDTQIINFAEEANNFAQNNLITEIPFTKSGVIASQSIKQKGYPTAVTDTFSCRQLLLVFNLELADIANVNISKINNYFEQNHLGNGHYIGQKVAISTQNRKNDLDKRGNQKPHLLVSGLQSYLQLCELGGIDVIDLTPFEAISAKEKLAPGFDSALNKSHFSTRSPILNASQSQLNKLWDLSIDEENLLYFQENEANSQIKELLTSENEILDEFFPLTSQKHRNNLALQGKTPKHYNWRRLIKSNKVSIDALLTTASIIEKQKLAKKLRKLIHSKVRQLSPSFL